MTIIKKGNSQNNNQNTNVAPEQPQQQQQQAQQNQGFQQQQQPFGQNTNQQPPNGANPNSLSGMAALQELYGNAIPLDVGSGVLNTYLDSFRETYAEKKQNGSTTIKAEFIGLPQETLQLPYSGIAVCYIHAAGVTVHTLLLEDDGPLPDPRTFTIGQHETVEVPTTPADTYNENYYLTVLAQLKHKFGNVEIINGGMQVVYRTIDLEDPNQINQLLTAATNAAVGATSLNTLGSDVSEGRTLAYTLQSNGIQLHASVNTSPERLVSANGLPVRRDILVKSVATVPGATQNNLRGTRGSGFCFAELSAFATLEYVVPEAPVFNPYQPQAVVPTQRYVPRIVITDIGSAGIQTLPSVLLGISTATVIQEGLLWTEPFRPQKGRSKNDYDIKDIGAIGYDIKELNVDDKPAMINTKSNDFTNADFYQLMAATVHSSPMYSIDIEEAGPLSWLTLVFSAAANNDLHARRTIIDACNSLTNNMFSNHFGENDRIIESDNNRVFLGTYRPHNDTTGELRDIRDLDYLAILNICGEDPRVVEDFERTQRASSGLPLVARLAELQGILEQIMGASLTIKGYANRFTFHHTFIEALAKSTREAKVAPMFSNLPVHVQENARQRVHDFQWAMVQQQAVGGVYQGSANQMQAGMPLMPYQTMWNGYAPR